MAEFDSFDRFTILALFALLLGMPALSQSELANTGSPIPSMNSLGTVVGGYDVVAYIDYGEATEGDPQYYVDHENTYRFRFASKVTMKKFMGDPDRYMPAFGGYCALSLGVEPGEVPGLNPGLHRAEPKIFKVIDGRVHLFSSENALERWNENEEAYRARAESNWDAILEARKKSSP